MDALFKKFVNTGVGYLSQGTKLVQTTVEKLVAENKISEQEGQKIVADLLKSGEAKRADLEKQFKKLTTDLRARVGLGDEEAVAIEARPAATKKPISNSTAKAAGAKASAATAKTPRSTTTKASVAKKAAAPARRPEADQQ